MSTTNGDSGPGGGAAFWAALGVRIEPEPVDEVAVAVADEAQPEAEQARPEAEETRPEAETLVDQAESEPMAGKQAPATEQAVDEQKASEQKASEQATDDRVTDEQAAVEQVALEQSSAEQEQQQPPVADDDVSTVEEPVLAARSQASLDDVEPQEGVVVDGLAALNETLAENRRLRETASRAEPAWQLAGELSGALPPLKACLEAILMVVDEPVTDVVLAQVVERPKGEVSDALRELAEEYAAQGRGFELREVGIGGSGHGSAASTGWRMYSRPECATVVERFVRDGQQAKLTQAALETLAVVAYRQPVSRSKVSAIRGVNCDGVMRTLLARGLVEECGTEYETGALLYQTTGYFLERMGLKSLDELPDLAPLLPTAAEVEEEEA